VSSGWDPDFLERSAMFAPLRVHGASLRTADWPRLDELQRALAGRRPPIAVASGASLAFVLQSPRAATLAARYEPRIYLRGEVQIRERNWHDLMNALVWLTFPRSKAALNARHHGALLVQQASGAPNRGPVQDAMTLFDEGGVLVASRDPGLLQRIEAFQWKRLFWHERSRVVRDMRFFLFGHALYEKALNPFTGITARGLLFEVDRAFLAAPIARQLEQLDALAAMRLSDPAALRSPAALAPLPILGVPGWCAANAVETYYDNTAYFRAGRTRPTRA
jgi:hypothetical protein